jgi:hypothetical protein
MGVHYVNGALLNGELEVSHPQALIYEPSNGGMRLVGRVITTTLRCWRAKSSNSLTAQTASTYLRSLSCTYGPGEQTLRVPTWTGTIM